MHIDAHPGLMLSSELTPAQLISLAQLAETSGYDELWYTDQRFWRDCYAGLSLIATHTSTLRIGPGVNDPFTRHPALIAMAIATLDELSSGRAQLGLGVGGSGIAQMNLPKQRPVRALQEAIEIVNAMVTGERVDYDGQLFQVRGASLGFQPARSHVPIAVATHGPQVLRLSGRMADSVLLGNMGRRDAVERAAAIVREGESQAGREPGEVGVNLRLEALITEDRDDAFMAMRKRVAHRLVVSHPNWGFLGDHVQKLDPAVFAAAECGETETVERLLTRADVQATMLLGAPAEVASQLCGLLTDDVTRVTIRPYGDGLRGQETTVRLFAEQVWPSVQAQAGASGGVLRA